MRRIALIAAALAVLSGCGGEAKTKDTFTAGEWAARAEAACKRATDKIAARGWPQDLEQLRSRASDAADDARGAIHEIERLPVPADRADDVRAFVDGLDGLRRKIDDVIRATTAMDLSGLHWAAGMLRGDLPTLRSVAADAGLRKCLQGAELQRVEDAIRAPVAAEQFVRLDIALADGARKLAKLRGTARLRALADMFGDAADAAGTIIGPSWVEDDVWRYSDALDALAAVGRTTSPAYIRTRVQRANRLENRIRRRLRASPITTQAPAEQS